MQIFFASISLIFLGFLKEAIECFWFLASLLGTPLWLKGIVSFVSFLLYLWYPLGPLSIFKIWNTLGGKKQVLRGQAYLSAHGTRWVISTNHATPVFTSSIYSWKFSSHTNILHIPRVILVQGYAHIIESSALLWESSVVVWGGVSLLALSTFGHRFSKDA